MSTLTCYRSSDRVPSVADDFLSVSGELLSGMVPWLGIHIVFDLDVCITVRLLNFAADRLFALVKGW